MSFTWFYFIRVSVPPDSLSVINEKGDHIPNYILGPYLEGSSVNITCIATGGKESLFFNGFLIFELT